MSAGSQERAIEILDEVGRLINQSMHNVQPCVVVSVIGVMIARALSVSRSVTVDDTATNATVTRIDQTNGKMVWHM